MKLEDITGIGKTTAERLKSAGIDSVEKMASVNLESLLKVNGIGKSTAVRYIQTANELLKNNEKADIKKGLSIRKLDLKKVFMPKSKYNKRSKSIEKEIAEIKPKEKEIAEIKPKEKEIEIPITDKDVNSTETKPSDKKATIEKVEIPKPMEFSKEEIIPKKQVTSKSQIPKRQVTSKAQIPKKQITSKAQISKKQRVFKKLPERLKSKQKFLKNKQKEIKAAAVKTFFHKDTIEKIRFLHYKIKVLEKLLEKEDLSFDTDDLKPIIDYVKLLNVNYKTQSQIKIFKELELAPKFYDPLEDLDYEIWDLMYECSRALWVLARAYTQLSYRFENENKFRKSIVAMVECSKAYKTSSYFSKACLRQEDIGKSLSADNLEFNSEEARGFAQSIAAIREENKLNLFRASKMYAGLSALTQRLLYLKNHDKLKEHQLKAQFYYDMGKACHLKAKAFSRSSISKENIVKIRRLQEKANYYYYKSEDLWENMLENFDGISIEERKNLEINLSIVNENIVENDVEILDYDEVKNIQNPEPFIVVPENLAYFLPRTTQFLTRYPSKSLEYGKYRGYKNLKYEANLRQNKLEGLKNKKAGIGRTIKELKSLYENDDIDITKFSELLEKYSVKLKMMESSVQKLEKIYKEKEPGKKKRKEPAKKQLKHTVVSM